jgi:hypothetical protein
MHKKKVSIQGFNSLLNKKDDNNLLLTVLRGLTKAKLLEMSTDRPVPLGSWSGWSW